jgi:hypothetical protein
MNKKDTTAKLAANQAATKRWHSRLVRATNALTKLAKQRQRLLAAPKPTATKPLIEGKVRKGGQNPPPQDFVRPEPPPAFLPGADDLKIPAILTRPAEPQLVDKLKASRPPVDKKAMPLAGRDAEAFLKAKSAEVTKRRQKRKLA